ncbi:MAG: helicase HerA domain-containing protein [Vicinamibacteria bacterium]
MNDFEKLGAFYLGRGFDLEREVLGEDPLLYDAKDLTTHGLIVGMTGSGKTGLSIVLLEEAAIDGIPAIVIDPKGDMGNLLLSFPALRPADFRPWIDESEAQRKGIDPESYAAETAEMWREGLEKWGQDPERIARFCSAVDVSIYTPGSQAGLPLSLLRSFAAPPAAQAKDVDALRERVLTAASSLLALLGMSGPKIDPIRSREHILLSKLLEDAWSKDRDVTLESLVRETQEPPFDKMGVMDLESFFPARDRKELAMQLNNLIASPSFAAWREGEPLDIKRLLYTSTGQPRLSIVSIAHLGDAERMFFVSMLLNEVVAWMRTLPGTGSLRAILYMDEIFGFFPPTADPPSKRPMLTLLKQARAYGLGVLLATQNPVDLDYKGLSNTGTWFLGRLQTERDKERVMDGLEGASAGGRFDRGSTERLLAALGQRVFLMHNVHEDAPTVFQTRWALSYLRGPLTSAQIESLTSRQERDRPSVQKEPPRKQDATPFSQEPPVPDDISQGFLPIREPVPQEAVLLYRPALSATARLHYVHTRNEVDHWETVWALLPLAPTASVNWESCELQEGRQPTLQDQGFPGARFAELPAPATESKSYATWGESLADHLYRSHTLSVWENRELRETSLPREDARDFRMRLSQTLREKRDAEVENLRKLYAPKLARLEEQIRRAEERLAKEKAQYKDRTVQTAISFGATVLGALLGRKVVSAGSVGRATTTARSAGRAAREREDVGNAEQEVERCREELKALEEEFENELEALRELPDPSALKLEEIPLRPRRSDISVSHLILVWTPWRQLDEGTLDRCY